jgi:hypothetical protein
LDRVGQRDIKNLFALEASCNYVHDASNWLFAGSLRAGKRAAAIMTLIRSAQLNGHDPLAYLKDVLTRLPTHRAADVAQLLPHRWTPTAA